MQRPQMQLGSEVVGGGRGGRRAPSVAREPRVGMYASVETARRPPEPAPNRKLTPTMMNYPEPLKVFLQHRIKTIISKEWWDFVVNVNNMNSDHASLLYSVANLCPSFQNFLRTRDKELKCILEKRPQITPRIFSGSEKINSTSSNNSNSISPTQKKSCSAELDQILSEMYPEERSIIKRNPRTFGPISKQKRMLNAKKYQASLHTPKDSVSEDAESVTLSKLLRDENNCPAVRDVVEPIQPIPSTSSNKDSKQKTHKVEYTISNYDVNRNKLSLNMKKVKKKIIKVKKKIMTYTDNNDKSRTKYLLESETPDLKRDMIRKYRIKKCSVVLEKLNWKQIKELTCKGKSTKNSSTSKSTEAHNKDSSTCNKKLPNITISIKQANSKEPLVTVVQKDKINSAVSKEPSPIHCNGRLDMPRKPPPVLPDKPLPVIENSTNSVIKLPRATENSLSNNISESSKKLPDKTSNLTSSKEVTLVKIKKESSSAPGAKETKQPLAELKQPDVQKSVVSSKQDQLTALKSITVVPKSNSKQTSETNDDSVITNSLPPSSEEMTKVASVLSEEPPAKRIKIEKENSVASSVEKPKSPLNKADNTYCETQSNTSNKCTEKTISNSISASSIEKESENSLISAKFRLNQKENVAITAKFMPQEVAKELYCHGAIVPLGKKSTVFEKPAFDKSKHFLSLKEKKIKDSLPEANDAVTPLKEKNLQNLPTETKGEGTTLNSLKNAEKSKEALKTVDNSTTDIVKLNNTNISAEYREETSLNKDDEIPVNNSDKNNSLQNHSGERSDHTINTKNNADKINISDKINSPDLSLNGSEELSNGVIRNDTEETDNDEVVSKPDSGVGSLCDKENSYIDDFDDPDKLIIDECVSMEVEVNTSSFEETELGKDDEASQDKGDESSRDKGDEASRDKGDEASQDKRDKAALGKNVDKDLEKNNAPEQDKNDKPEPQKNDEPEPQKNEEQENDIHHEAEEVKNDEAEQDKDVDADVIIVETPPEIIEIDSDDDDDLPQVTMAKIKKEQIEEPAEKRPRIELNVTKMKIDRQCKVCHATFVSHDEWLQHYDKEVPKCTPNLQVSWDPTQMALIK